MRQPWSSERCRWSTFSLYSASTSMNCFTSSTVKKCRATSSMEPRHPKRGRSAMVMAGIVHVPPSLMSDSIDGGRSCRSVCTPRKIPAGVPLMRTESRVTVSWYSSPVAAGFTRSAIEPAFADSGSTGTGYPVAGRSSAASISPVRATSAMLPTTIDDVESSRKGSPASSVTDTGSGTMLWAMPRAAGAGAAGRRWPHPASRSSVAAARSRWWVGFMRETIRKIWVESESSVRRGHVKPEPELLELTRITRIEPAAAELPVEPWGGTEMQKDAQVESECRDVAAELAAGALRQPLRGLQLDDHPPLDEHVDAMEADLLTAEGHDGWILTIDPEPSIPHRDLEGARIKQLDEPIPELVVHVKKTPDDSATKLLLDDDRPRGAWSLRGAIRVHSGNSALAVRGPATQIFP